MKRQPVTLDGIRKIQNGSYFGGIPSPGIKTGTIDKSKVKIASSIERHNNVTGLPRNAANAGLTRTAGMMLEYNTMPYYQSDAPYGGEFTSYATGNADYGSGSRDIPNYFVMMNQQNGGVLYWPVSLKEKYEWYRYFARTDAYVGRAMELLSDLPMSKITLHMPKMENKKFQEEIHSFYVYMCDKINLFEKLQQILWENNMIGNAFAFHEWNNKDKIWNKIIILPPEEVNAFTFPFSDNTRIEFRPSKLISLIRQYKSDPNVFNNNTFYKDIIDNIPRDVIDSVSETNCIIMDGEPIVDGQVGSFTHQFSRRRTPYLDLGASVLERVLVPMLMKENFRYTQLALATRNMTPKNKVSAPGLLDEELDDLRTQIDLSYMDPDYSIITNYDWNWEQIGAEGRLLDLQSEYEMIENQVFAGLGVTRELLTGEGTYSGNKITVEILNTIFMLTREMLINYVEKKLFLPVAEAHGWYETGKYGIKKYFYPKVGFNRLSIRDNREVFENLFQLYQKGSLPIDVILELFNVDSDRVSEQVKKDLFTIKDSTFNRTIENINEEVGRAIAEKTNVVDKVADYLNLKIEPQQKEEGFGNGFGEDLNSQELKSQDGLSNINVEEFSDVLSNEIPDDITKEDVEEIVEKIDV